MTRDTDIYGGARALAALHAKHLRAFLVTWRRADAAGVALPASENPNYASRETLLAHVLGGSARYLIWIREKLELPPLDLEARPDPDGLPARADAYLEHVLAAWDAPLHGLTAERAYSQAYEARWGPPYCIDAMLEHAVMHPLRHSYQLEGLLAKGETARG